MEIRDFAEAVLFAENLQSKLFFPTTKWTDDKPKTYNLDSKLISKPKLTKSHKALEAGSKFPSTSQLESSQNVARVLHYFANHELLALELMALCLLRFPDAPFAFRRGLANEMIDEARHLVLYRERMRALGLDFGDIPTNDFFWKLISGMQHPKEFCLNMGMTFEQANLDFSLHFLNQFKEIGDQETAGILNTVYEDEIAHVGFGLHWYKKFNKTTDDELYVDHRDSLIFPMGLQRAKAPKKAYDEIGRKRAGFPSSYIEELKYFSSSKERPPVLRYFNPEIEDSLSVSGKSFTPKNITKNLKVSLEHFMWVGSLSQDVILVSKKPSKHFLDQFVRLKISYPEYVVSDLKSANKLLAQRKFMDVQPWASSRSSREFHRCNSDRVINQVQDYDFEALHSQTSSLELLKKFSKFINDKHPGLGNLMIEPDDIGSMFTVADEAFEYAKALGDVVVKAPLGLSGRGVFFFNPSQFDECCARIEAILKKQGKVIVEKRLERVFDFSLQKYPNTKDLTNKYKLARFFSGNDGSYNGGVVGRSFLADLNSSVRRFWSTQESPENSVSRFLEIFQDYLENYFSKQGFYEAAGIDCFVFKDEQGELRIKPLVEINARMNMGFFKSKLASKIHSSSVGYYNVYRRSHLRELTNELVSEIELQTKSGLITRGIFFISDPEADGDFLAVLSVDKSLEKARELMQKIFT